jgi:uncharacterized protein (DUF58 family)
MIIRKTFWAIVVIFVGSILGVLITRAGVYYRLIYLCLMLVAISWVWARISVSRVTVQRTSRGFRQQLGQVFEEQFSISNQFKFTKPWIEVIDGSGLPGSGSTRILSWIKANSVRNYSGYTLLSRRGEFSLSPTILYSGDPFGLFAFRKVIDTRARLLVLPYLCEIRDFPLPSGRLPGGLAVRRRTPEVEPPRAAGVREWAPGDSLNRIHWPTTARRDRMMVKEFEQDPQADIWIFLDSQRDVQIKTKDAEFIDELEQIPLWWLNRSEFKLPADTFEYSVSIAGTIAKYFSRREQVVGFACAGQKRVVLSSERGERQLSKILETLAVLNSEGMTPLVSLIESQVAFVPKGSTVVVITPSGDKSIMGGIASLVRRGLRPVVVLIDPSSFGDYYKLDALISELQSWRIPYNVIKYGDDLRLSLEKGFSGI